ncbi:hypothetical protein GUJ93_ZPchr0009g609 [Zizania palustris]|uniref:C2H2-type domain-containing protein n=1 Tax=Zizania palustris TaxID=103762 RepID=A0A8J5R906_ZIZPA|nr:hypothetical protein GUJ93_ZPchr0009g609 [Zizania palustris]
MAVIEAAAVVIKSPPAREMEAAVAVGSSSEDEVEVAEGLHGGGQLVEGLAKRKRSRRRRRASAVEVEPTEEYLALCLLMLASGRREGDCAPAVAAAEHRCSVCGKAFASYQALGGHKASHRKPQSPPPAAPEVKEEEEEMKPATPAPSSSAVKPSSSAPCEAAGASRAHECNVCGRTFTTGQALGGHKRCHYDGNIGSAAASKTAKSAAAVAASRGFDLNLPALPETGERCTSAEEDPAVLSPLAFKKPRLMIPA